jgi:hypothetical protein
LKIKLETLLPHFSNHTFQFLPIFQASAFEKELLQKELKAINWNEVDEYPSIVDCDTLTPATRMFF